MNVNGIPYEEWKQPSKEKVRFVFGEDVWGVIKEFAGIYKIGTQWGKVSKASWPKICSIYASIDVRDAKIVRKGLHGLRKYKNLEVWKNLYKLGQPAEKRKSGINLATIHLEVGFRVVIFTTRDILCIITRLTPSTIYTTSGPFRASAIRGIQVLVA